MLALATTTVSILGGGTASTYGDDIEGTDVVAAGIPASIIEGREVVATESDPQARVIRYYTGRIPTGTAINNNQRIRDDISGTLYVVNNVTSPTNPAIPMDIRLDLRRVT